MNKELDLWQFVHDRLVQSQPVMLLVVTESTGSSPGRQGYKMAVGANGELMGSIGGGVMEVRLVEQSRAILSEPGAVGTGFRDGSIKDQVHQKQSPHASGMICSGRQTVIFKKLDAGDHAAVESVIASLENHNPHSLTITSTQFHGGPPKGGTLSEDYFFERTPDGEFLYQERLGPKNNLYIIGGGHCALALSEMMSSMDFRISIFDDRPDLNTIEKNRFADEIFIVDAYENIGALIPLGRQTYVVVMTLGYKFDEAVVRALFEKDFHYFGVLGSKAKMKTLLKALEKDGFARERLARIHTPIGLPINSHTPEEIAVSIAAEIIAVKNS